MMIRVNKKYLYGRWLLLLCVTTAGPHAQAQSPYTVAYKLQYNVWYENKKVPFGKNEMSVLNNYVLEGLYRITLNSTAQLQQSGKITVKEGAPVAYKDSLLKYMLTNTAAGEFGEFATTVIPQWQRTVPLTGKRKAGGFSFRKEEYPELEKEIPNFHLVKDTVIGGFQYSIWVNTTGFQLNRFRYRRAILYCNKNLRKFPVHLISTAADSLLNGIVTRIELQTTDNKVVIEDWSIQKLTPRDIAFIERYINAYRQIPKSKNPPISKSPTNHFPLNHLSVMKKINTINIISSLLLIALLGITPATAQPFVHPGLLHTEADFARMKAKVTANAQPWKGSWDLLVANGRSQLTYTPNPTDTVRRGGTGENYTRLFNDIAAAYQTAIRWKITGDVAYANKSIAIMNAWSLALKQVTGNADRFLAAGIYGYEFANAAEIMRTYSGWAAADFTRFKDMMLNEFYPLNEDFLTNHNTACITNYWANWDLCNMASILAIGVLCDRRDLYNRAINYFKTGAGNGSITHAVWYLHSSTLGQWQESGRDQGHSTLGIGLMGAFCEMAWNQGDDMYGYDSNRFMKGAEYVAQYNIGNTVPYNTYTWGNGQNCAQMSQTVISSASRGNLRPVWEMVYNHYANRMGLSVPGMASYAALHRPEGGGGNYGTTSGGFDQLGFGSLTFTRDPLPAVPVNGTYKIFARHSGQLMEVANNATANGSNVAQWPANDCVCQQWTLTNTGSNQFTLVGAGSGKNLDVNGSSTADGANVQIWQSTNGANQKFTFTAVGGGFYRITPVHSGKSVEVTSNSLTNGANIQQWTYNSGKNQQWQLVRINLPAARMAAPRDTVAAAVNAGTELNVYPNPVTNKVTVTLPPGATGQPATALLSDINGRVLYTTQVTDSRYTFDLTGKAAGIYFIKITRGERTYTSRIMKK